MTQKRKRPIVLPTTDEIQSLFRAASRRTASGVRARAMMAVWYRAGLRLAESLDLMPADLDLDDGDVNVRRGKGGRQRIVPIDAGGAEIVGEWMRWRRKLGLTARHPVFAGYSAGAKGKPVAPRYAQLLIERLAERAGLEKRVHPHLLRHCYASELAKEGVPVPEIQKLLGHQSLETTQVYVDHISPEALRERIRAREGWTA